MIHRNELNAYHFFMSNVQIIGTVHLDLPSSVDERDNFQETVIRVVGDEAAIHSVNADLRGAVSGLPSVVF